MSVFEVDETIRCINNQEFLFHDCRVGQDYEIVWFGFNSLLILDDVGDKVMVHFNELPKHFQKLEKEEMSKQENNKHEWKVGDEFTMEDSWCDEWPSLYTKGKKYRVVGFNSKNNPEFMVDDGYYRATSNPDAMIPVKSPIMEQFEKDFNQMFENNGEGKMQEQKIEWKAGDECVIDVEKHDNKWPGYAGTFIKGRIYKIREGRPRS